MIQILAQFVWQEFKCFSNLEADKIIVALTTTSQGKRETN
jgi:hypothetical protein